MTWRGGSIFPIRISTTASILVYAMRGWISARLKRRTWWKILSTMNWLGGAVRSMSELWTERRQLRESRRALRMKLTLLSMLTEREKNIIFNRRCKWTTRQNASRRYDRFWNFGTVFQKGSRHHKDHDGAVDGRIRHPSYRIWFSAWRPQFESLR